MFERFKAYARLRKNEKFLKGCKIAAELTDDKVALYAVNDALCLNKLIKKEMWRKRKLAVSNNSNCKMNGF